MMHLVFQISSFPILLFSSLNYESTLLSIPDFPIKLEMCVVLIVVWTTLIDESN